ncbi:hypothetical protein GJ496_004483 [Pomphorhynchus laevis]|nr:hypothetical protein GJ496_004483 [Pomphorhynchus laevis]
MDASTEVKPDAAFRLYDNLKKSGIITYSNIPFISMHTQLLVQLMVDQKLVDLNYLEIIDILAAHFQRITCVAAVRFKFSQCEMVLDDSYANWLARLKELQGHVDFIAHKLQMSKKPWKNVSEIIEQGLSRMPAKMSFHSMLLGRKYPSNRGDIREIEHESEEEMLKCLKSVCFIPKSICSIAKIDRQCFIDAVDIEAPSIGP